MSRVPAPSRRVLIALVEGDRPPTPPRPAGTKIGRLFNDLYTLLEQQDEALVALNRLAEQGNGEDEGEASHRGAMALEERLADATADTAAALLLAPIESACDLQLKLMVLIGASEPHPDDAHAFPGLYLRALLADLSACPLSIESGFINR